MQFDASSSALLLVAAVAAVGVLHTMVPDHWVPIAVVARQRGWSTAETARAALFAGLGHTLSTLAIAVVVWLGGVVLAARFGHLIGVLSSVALIAFGLWIVVGAWRELHAHGQPGHEHATGAAAGHAHRHRHPDGTEHVHWHAHDALGLHEIDSSGALAAPIHNHDHPATGRTALLLILGSSPMIEGIPAFFAAARFGIVQLVVMAIVFAAATMLTYVGLCVASVSGLQRVRFGAFERYGEVLSGVVVAALGVVFLFVPFD